ncbi:MAG: response regulator, partial [Leptospiraceae bacterium]|nr:response regulator [Leptospiraceae bacterium]
MIEVEFESQLTGRVLVVDDSEDNLRLVEAFLHKTELEIRSAASGEQALRIAPSFQPDLILLDV